LTTLKKQFQQKKRGSSRLLNLKTTTRTRKYKSRGSKMNQVLLRGYHHRHPWGSKKGRGNVHKSLANNLAQKAKKTHEKEKEQNKTFYSKACPPF
jgi:hypothetical protein